MASVCYTWSLSAEQKFQGLCAMPLKAETANKTTQCEVCANPTELFNLCDACVSFSPLMYKVTIAMSAVGTIVTGPGGCGASYNGDFIVYKSGPPSVNSCTYYSQERAALVYCDVPFSCDDSDILLLAALRPNPLGGGGPGHNPSLHWKVALFLYKSQVGFNSYVTGYSVTAQWFEYQSLFGAQVLRHSAQARGNGTELDCWKRGVYLPSVVSNPGSGGFTQRATPFGCGVDAGVTMTATVTPLGTPPL